MLEGRWTMTARLEVRYRKPIFVGQTVRAFAEKEERATGSVRGCGVGRASRRIYGRRGHRHFRSSQGRNAGRHERRVPPAGPNVDARGRLRLHYPHRRRAMVSTRPATGLTYEDYAKTSDDERWELLDGELVMVPAPNTFHQRVATDLVTLLNAFVKERYLGSVFSAPTDVVLSDTNVVQPDLLFVSREREHIITRANIQGAPDLAVEIRSPSTAERDLTVKRRLYAEHGVKEYWAGRPRRHDSDCPAAWRERLPGGGHLPERAVVRFAHAGGVQRQLGRDIPALTWSSFPMAPPNIARL